MKTFQLKKKLSLLLVTALTLDHYHHRDHLVQPGGRGPRGGGRGGHDRDHRCGR